MVSAAQVAILATGTLASAAVVRRADACAPNADVAACASNLAKSFVVKTGTTFKYTAKVSWNQGRPPAPNGYINPEVTVALSNCKLSAPIVTKKGSAATCGTTSCKKTLDFDVVQTTTEAGHQFVTVGTNGQFQFTAPNPAVWDSGIWTAQTLTPQTTTVSKDFTLAANQKCVPTTVQYQLGCTGSIIPTTTSWNGMVCGQPMMNNPTNSAWLDFCAAIASGYAFPVTLDLHQPTGETWSVQGCSSS